MKKYGKNFPKIGFNVDDTGSLTWPKTKEHSMTYHKNEPERKNFTGPDWTFYHWPSSRIHNSMKTFQDILKAGEKNPTHQKVAWFGNIRSAGRLPEKNTRPMLVNEFAKKYPDKFEFIDANKRKNYMSQAKMTQKYSTLLDIGGNGYSGRLKFLLFSNRPLLLVERNYIEYFNDDLIPYTHYIPVNMYLDDLNEKYQWILDNQQKAKEIAQNARQYAIENFTIDKILERLDFVFNNFLNSQ